MGILRRLMHLAAQKIHRPTQKQQASQAPFLIQGTKSHLQEEPLRKQETRNAAAEEADDLFSFEVDWSVFSMAYIQMTIQEILFTLAGLPIPENPAYKQWSGFQGGYWRSHLDPHKVYLRGDLREGTDNGFLVRGVIYDMAAIASPPRRVKEEDGPVKDWSNLIYENLNAVKDNKIGKVEDIRAEQVMEKLGLKNTGGLKERVGGSSSALLMRKQLEEKQKLEEIIGTGDSIRAKYADRIRQKKVLAEARREQGKLGIFVTASPGGSDKSCSVMPGSPSLVRYLEERGVVQALLTRGPESDVKSLMDQLGNFQFGEVRRLRDNFTSEGEVLSEEMLSSICSKWGLPTKQVLVVIGGNGESEQLLKTVADKGYFVCRVQGGSISDDEQRVDSHRSSNKPKNGVVSWFNQLAEGTLHLQEEKKPKTAAEHVHFRVLDMTELKWVIEDLNGVSYRSSTVVRGFK